MRDGNAKPRGPTAVPTRTTREHRRQTTRDGGRPIGGQGAKLQWIPLPNPKGVTYY